ncbi:MAG: hypothetical protein PHG25_00060 [Candidatus Pacebacteria bacterium]|nr:hypothetical protein [Candidatus Paceibacterota bacterium]
MKKIYAKPNTSLVPQPRSFTRRIKQMLASARKRQYPVFTGDLKQEVIQLLKDLEHRIEILEREKASETKRGQK